MLVRVNFMGNFLNICLDYVESFEYLYSDNLNKIFDHNYFQKETFIDQSYYYKNTKINNNNNLIKYKIINQTKDLEDFEDGIFI
tara:strand:- start:4294 stop:4545 length:252 start_codon:yes stop_codon:yes gene_type:complete